MQYESKTSSIIASPHHKTVADKTHVSVTVTGGRKVMGMCHIRGTLTQITHTLLFHT